MAIYLLPCNLNLSISANISVVRYLINIFFLLRFTLMAFQATRENGRFHRRVKRKASAVILQSRKLNDGTVSERAFLKIQWYMVSTLFMSKLIATLAGNRISQKEERAFYYLGALIGLSDILVDDYHLEGPWIEALLHSPGAGNNAIEKIFALYYQALLKEVETAKAARLKEGLLELVHFQIASLRQFDARINEQEIEAITRGKGGASLRLCAALFPTMKEQLQGAIYRLGGFIQYLNDAQDLPKDARDGVTTFIRFRENFQDAARFLGAERRATFGAFKAPPLAHWRRHYFLFCFHAMYVLILYKLSHYARVCRNRLDLEQIAGMRKEAFRVNPFSPVFVWACFGQIINFRPKATD